MNYELINSQLWIMHYELWMIAVAFMLHLHAIEHHTLYGIHSITEYNKNIT